MSHQSKTSVRLPADLYQRLVVEAAQRGVSVNYLIVERLDGSRPAEKARA